MAAPWTSLEGEGGEGDGELHGDKWTREDDFLLGVLRLAVE